MSQDPTVLAVNCGSSSLKFGSYRCKGGELLSVCSGEAEEIGLEEASFWVQQSGQDRREQKTAIPNHEAAFALAWNELIACQGSPPHAIGHRLVHGGPHLRSHQLLTPEIGQALEGASDFAPLHVPVALAVLHASERMSPGTAQVICLDTAFHHTLPDVSRTLPLPADLRREGVERYGFHGLSLESILDQLSQIPRRLIVAHLGNGCSITAIRDGESIDTTMAMTPNAGLMMGTRCGDLDPGVATYLAHRHGASAEEIDELLNRKSGLIGVSELSSDVRELSAARSTNSHADLALRMFCQQVAKQVAAMSVVLGGVDTLVFTGGIGEHATELRTDITAKLGPLGHFQTLVLPAREDLQIAKITARLTKSC